MSVSTDDGFCSHCHLGFGLLEPFARVMGLKYHIHCMSKMLIEQSVLVANWRLLLMQSRHVIDGALDGCCNPDELSEVSLAITSALEGV